MGDGKCARERRVDGAEGAVIFRRRIGIFVCFRGPLESGPHLRHDGGGKVCRIVR